MNDESMNGHEAYDLNDYEEDVLEDDYYDEELFEDDYYDEEFDDDYDDDEAFSEARRRRRRPGRRGGRRGYAGGKTRGEFPFWEKNQEGRRGYAGGKTGGRRPQYGNKPYRPKPKPYLQPTPPSKPPSTKNVVKAFGAASMDIEKTKAAVRKVDIDNKVQEDKVRRALNVQSRRITGNEYALAATTVVDKLKEEFPEFKENQVVNTALPLLPLLFQKPAKKEFFKDPRIISTILTAGIAIFKEVRKKDKASEAVQNVTISPPTLTLEVGEKAKNSFSAVARDSKGNVILGKSFEWFSANDKIATVENGTVTILDRAQPGTVQIFARETSSGLIGSVGVTIFGAP